MDAKEKAKMEAEAMEKEVEKWKIKKLIKYPNPVPLPPAVGSSRSIPGNQPCPIHIQFRHPLIPILMHRHLLLQDAQTLPQESAVCPWERDKYDHVDAHTQGSDCTDDQEAQ